MPVHKRARPERKLENLLVRIDRASKSAIREAARLRGVSASDYVRSVVAAQARRDLEEMRTRTIRLSPDEQLAFWKALQEPASPTARQRELGKLMRGAR